MKLTNARLYPETGEPGWAAWLALRQPREAIPQAPKNQSCCEHAEHRGERWRRAPSARMRKPVPPAAIRSTEKLGRFVRPDAIFPQNLLCLVEWNATFA